MFNMRKRLVALSLAAVIGGMTLLSASHGQTPLANAVDAPSGAITTQKPLFQAVARIGMTVADLDRSIAFFHDVLSFQKVSEREVAGKEWEQETGVFGLRCRIAEMKLGNEIVELTEYVASAGRPYPSESRSNDRWFQHIAIITSDMEAAYARLRANKVRFASTGPQTLPDWNRNAAGIKAFHFRDPDGHVLEVLQLPKGKGQEQWQSKDALFLGIDHTAIVVQNTDKSLAFYRDLCGMTVAGGSENYGSEQEHLNNVEGARLRITTLRAAAGPAVELLEYLNPRDGKPYPSDEKPNDLVHWQTSVLVADAEATQEVVTKVGKTGPVVTLDDRQRVLIRDPDGHALQVIGER